MHLPAFVKIYCLQIIYLSRNGSQLRVSKFISMVRDALVTSVRCRPPLTPPVKFWNKRDQSASWPESEHCCAIYYPNQPSVHRAKQAAPFFNGHANFRDVVHQPAEFESAKVGADGQSAILLQDVLVATLHFGQQGFDSGLGAGIQPD